MEGEGMTDGEPAEPVDGGQRLLSAVDYGQAVDSFFWNAIEHVARISEPLYAAMSSGDLQDVDGVTVEVNGTSVVSPMVHVTYEIPIDPEDVRNTNLGALHAAIHMAASSKLNQVKDAYGTYMDSALDAVGHNLKIPQDSFGWDTVLGILAIVEWAEGADGKLHPPRQLTGAAVPDLPPLTPEQELRMQQIDAQKQEEHVARRRSRRLRRTTDRARV
jgi:hypothetical protein